LPDDKQTFKIQILDAVILALREDIGSGDITTNTIIPMEMTAKAKITAKEDGVICGMSIIPLIFMSVDKELKLKAKVKDGTHVKKGRLLAEVSGPARSILTAERTALNFLQRLSGISTITSKFVKAAGKKVKILDTRKTSPGLRLLDKYAVKCGGGMNHRIGLFDAILIKDNHIKLAGGVIKAVSKAKSSFQYVEVEADSMSRVKDAAGSGASRILLDNMNIKELRSAVRYIRSMNGKVEIEASGGVNLSNISKVAKTGVDFISIGALTHSAPALDISLKI
jgi:nicotinate-nucleotide pyrophosphorylase (carboxylating)